MAFGNWDFWDALEATMWQQMHATWRQGARQAAEYVWEALKAGDKLSDAVAEIKSWESPDDVPAWEDEPAPPAPEPTPPVEVHLA